MVARILSSAVFGQGRPGLLGACPAFIQFSARLGVANTGLNQDVCHNRYTHGSSRVPQPLESSQTKKLVQQRDAGESLRPKIKSQFNALIDAAKDEHKHLTSRDQFSLAVDQFLVREKYRKGHVAFIRLALQRMDEFGLEKDLATYNKLLQVFPEGRFKPRRMLDALWPRSLPQMELALDLLTKMEDNGVNPSMETYHIVKEIFGGNSFPFQKCVRMMYLFDKYENADPYRIYGDLPTNPVELARLTLKRIAGKDGQITEHMVPEDDDTDTGYVAESSFLLSASTGAQVKQLQSIDETGGLLLHVEGPNRLWLRSVQTHYFSLKMSKQDSSDNLADEGAVLGVCMCHPGSQESLQDWLTALQETYPTLAKATVIYNIRKTESPSSSDSNLQLPPHRTRLTSGELGSIEECVTNIQQSHEYY